MGRNQGAKNPRWKGGRRKRKDGYVLVYAPGHPFAARNFVLEHRLVMEAHLGRYLTPDELVHHVNEKKDDNRLENLELTTHAEHARHHFTGCRFPDRWKPKHPKEAFVDLYVRQQLLLREVAEKLSISYGSVRYHLEHYGIAIRGKGWHWKRNSGLS